VHLSLGGASPIAQRDAIIKTASRHRIWRGRHRRGISSFGQTCWQWKTYMRRANIDFI
jgi:hypothetical protein